MKREEKNHLSRQKIRESAMKEFGEQGYGLSSINTICSAGEISKGILYHYYKDRDELYLDCVKEVFDGLTAALRENVMTAKGGIEEGLGRYFDGRVSYFREHPAGQRIFCEAIVSPPQHLREAIRGLRREFDQLNVDVLTSLLEQVRLCSGTTVEEVAEIFRLYQDFASARYQTDMAGGENGPEAYEEICRKSIRVLLYGVIEREGNRNE